MTTGDHGGLPRSVGSPSPVTLKERADAAYQDSQPVHLIDGFATGERQALEAPFGHARERLRGWMFGTRLWDASGAAGMDDAFAERHEHGIGAEIMGANKFGPPGVAGLRPLAQPLGASTCGSAAAPPSYATLSPPDSSTTCTWSRSE